MIAAIFIIEAIRQNQYKMIQYHMKWIKNQIFQKHQLK
ncbi:unnamed protein product [Paramecium sonneborni]|uniref:Uncharacterized protein n=1 Tax=Paramecium sonneborni TaxID=65129 RepID=A0A8S1NS75_9CILI|nr:unnamed protein product [Paramecium sonneborni]